MNAAATDSRDSIFISPVEDRSDPKASINTSPFRREAARRVQRVSPDESLLSASSELQSQNKRPGSLLTQSNINFTSPASLGPANWKESPIPVRKHIADEVESDFLPEIEENQEEKQDEVLKDKEIPAIPEERFISNANAIKSSAGRPIAVSPQKKTAKKRRQKDTYVQPNKRPKLSGPFSRYFEREGEWHMDLSDKLVEEIKQETESHFKEFKAHGLDLEKLKARELRIQAFLIEQIKKARHEKERARIAALQVPEEKNRYAVESQEKIAALREKNMHLRLENERRRDEIERLRREISERKTSREREKINKVKWKTYETMLTQNLKWFDEISPHGSSKFLVKKHGIELLLDEHSIQCMNVDQIKSQTVRDMFQENATATHHVESVQELNTYLDFIFKTLKNDDILDAASVASSSQNLQSVASENENLDHFQLLE